jgi:hypothetical protein
MAVFGLSGLVAPTAGHAGVSTLGGTMLMPDGSPAPNADGCLTLLRSVADDEDPTIIYFTTDSTGTFSVPIDVNQDMVETAALNGGTINLEIGGLADSLGRSPSDLPAEAIASGTTVLYDGVYAFAVPLIGNVESAGSAALALPNDLVLELTDTISLATALVRDESPVTTVNNFCGGIGGSQPRNCWFGKWGRIDGPRAAPTVLGELHTYQDMWGHFHYSTSANSEIGVAYQTDGGQWRVSGSVHIGNSTSVSNSGVPYASYRGTEIEGNFNYVKERRYFYCYGYRQASQQRVRALVWNGDVFPGADRSYSDGYYTWRDADAEGGARIARFFPTQRFSRDSSTTRTYSVGATVLGASVTSKTIYNTTHRLAYSFGRNVYWHYLIGSDGPPSTAGVVWAY